MIDLPKNGTVSHGSQGCAENAVDKAGAAVATDEGVAYEVAIATEEGAAYEAGVVTPEGAVVVDAVETDEGVVEDAAVIVPDETASEDVTADPDDEEKDKVTLSISKTQLASFLGTIPETLSRILAKMNKQGLVGVDGAVAIDEDTVAQAHEKNAGDNGTVRAGADEFKGRSDGVRGGMDRA